MFERLSPWTSYQSTIALLAVAVFSTNAGLFMFVKGMSPVTPALWTFLFTAACVPLLFRPSALSHVTFSPLVLWCVAFLLITTLWFAFFPATAIGFDAVKLRYLGVIFLLTMSLCLCDPQVQVTVRRALAVVVFFSAAMNVYDLLHPQQFSLVIGRAAGLYMNPNIAGGALIIAMLLAFDAVRPLTRYALVVATIVGVVLTASRGAALGLVLVLGMLLVSRKLRARQVLAGLCITLVVTGVVLVVTRTLDDVVFALEVTEQYRTRLTGHQTDTYSTDERREVALRALDVFVQEPLAGAGTGATARTAHNMYLTFMAEHGVLGAFIYPALLLTITWGAAREERLTIAALGLFLLWWGLFSHNILDDFHSLMALALIGSITAQSRISSVYAKPRREPAVARIAQPEDGGTQ